MRRTQTGLTVLAWLAMAAVPGACGKDGAGFAAARRAVSEAVGPGLGGSGQSGGGGVTVVLPVATAGARRGSSGSGGAMGVAGAPGGRGGSGIGGRAGGSGSGGSVAVGGSGGSRRIGLCGATTSWPVGCTVSPNVVCGNGTRDTCMGPAGLGPDCPLATFGELCDGNDVRRRDVPATGVWFGHADLSAQL